MLLFNYRHLQPERDGRMISIHLMLLFNTIIAFVIAGDCYFNISNVTIQLQLIILIIMDLLNFNTSNVTIQLLLLKSAFLLLIYFNTSNVTIQHVRCYVCAVFCGISIHLMLLFNNLGDYGGEGSDEFQYI